MRVSHTLRLVLISNWRCGSSTLANTFAPYTVFDWETRWKCLELFGKSYGEIVHYPAGRVREEFRRIGWEFDDYTVVSSVRNPWDRVLSLFLALHKAGTLSARSFDEFVLDHLPRWRGGIINRWNSYEMFHVGHEKVVDHVLRAETMEDELRTLAATRWPTVQLCYGRRDNVTRHKHYSCYYTDETREFVAQLFDYDVAEWSYRFEDRATRKRHEHVVSSDSRVPQASTVSGPTEPVDEYRDRRNPRSRF